MTEEAIERAKEFSWHQAQKHFPMSFHESERKTAAFIGRIAYLQGMQDPDANAEKISKLELENKRLREALEEKYQLKGSFKEYWNHRNSITIPFNSPSRDQESRHMLTWFHAITSWIAFKENIKALSSGGE